MNSSLRRRLQRIISRYKNTWLIELDPTIRTQAYVCLTIIEGFLYGDFPVPQPVWDSLSSDIYHMTALGPIPLRDNSHIKTLTLYQHAQTQQKDPKEEELALVKYEGIVGDEIIKLLGERFKNNKKGFGSYFPSRLYHTFFENLIISWTTHVHAETVTHFSREDAVFLFKIFTEILRHKELMSGRFANLNYDPFQLNAIFTKLEDDSKWFKPSFSIAVKFLKEQINPALYSATYQIKETSIKKALSVIAHAYLYRFFRNSTIIDSAREGNLFACALHLLYGADANSRSELGTTPLMYSTSNEDIRMMELLLFAGAQPNIRNNQDNDALMVAIKTNESSSYWFDYCKLEHRRNLVVIIRILRSYGFDYNHRRTTKHSENLLGHRLQGYSFLHICFDVYDMNFIFDLIREFQFDILSRFYTQKAFILEPYNKYKEKEINEFAEKMFGFLIGIKLAFEMLNFKKPKNWQELCPDTKLKHLLTIFSPTEERANIKSLKTDKPKQLYNFIISTAKKRLQEIYPPMDILEASEKGDLAACGLLLLTNDYPAEILRLALIKVLESYNFNIAKLILYVLGIKDEKFGNLIKHLHESSSSSSDSDIELEPTFFKSDYVFSNKSSINIKEIVNRKLYDVIVDGDPDKVRFYLSLGADPLQKDKDGDPYCLHAAFRIAGNVYNSQDKNLEKICRLMCSNPGATNALNQKRYYFEDTLLHYVAQFGTLSVVKLMIELGADPTIKNKEGKTPADCALENGREKIAEFLNHVLKNAVTIHRSPIPPPTLSFQYALIN